MPLLADLAASQRSLAVLRVSLIVLRLFRVTTFDSRAAGSVDSYDTSLCCNHLPRAFRSMSFILKFWQRPRRSNDMHFVEGLSAGSLGNQGNENSYWWGREIRAGLFGSSKKQRRNYWPWFAFYANSFRHLDRDDNDQYFLPILTENAILHTDYNIRLIC